MSVANSSPILTSLGLPTPRKIRMLVESQRMQNMLAWSLFYPFHFIVFFSFCDESIKRSTATPLGPSTQTDPFGCCEPKIGHKTLSLALALASKPTDEKGIFRLAFVVEAENSLLFPKKPARLLLTSIVDDWQYRLLLIKIFISAQSCEKSTLAPLLYAHLVAPICILTKPFRALRRYWAPLRCLRLYHWRSVSSFASKSTRSPSES